MKDQIIHILKSITGYISGEEISRQLKISRAGVWKNIQELRKDGYEIVAVPHCGYQLKSPPDKLLPREIQHNLRSRCVGKKIIYAQEISSTMDYAFRLGMEGEKEGTVICTETQTKGRGRMGRNWSSPKGKGIYMSVILRPQLPPTEVAQLTLLSAVAVCEAIRKTTGISVMIKWPNDILVGNKKLSGILTEMSAEMDRVRFIVIGVGINVNTPVSLLPAQSTSIKAETKKQMSRVVLMQEVLNSLDEWYGSLKNKSFSPVIERWKQLSSTLGKRIKIVDPSGEVEGEAVNLDDKGSLVIRRDSGVTVKKISGDVIQVG